MSRLAVRLVAFQELVRLNPEHFTHDGEDAGVKPLLHALGSREAVNRHLGDSVGCGGFGEVVGRPAAFRQQIVHAHSHTRNDNTFATPCASTHFVSILRGLFGR